MDPWLKSAGFVAAAVVGYVVLDSFVLSERPTTEVRAQARFDKARAETRAARWAYVAREKQIAPGTKVSWIVIPSKEMPDDPVMDINCLLFETDAGVAVICPGADPAALIDLDGLEGN